MFVDGSSHGSGVLTYYLVRGVLFLQPLGQPPQTDNLSHCRQVGRRTLPPSVAKTWSSLTPVFAKWINICQDVP